ncbi:MAG: putative amidase [Firmicutes bacterium]|nr:putative amidase [Bacillota bacterium]
MTRWARSVAAARRALGEAVVSLAPGAEAATPPDDALRYGVKDTPQIREALRQRLAAQPGIAWLTIDRPAPGGRAIDTGLRNPITGRPMTGSTSGGPVNILQGLIDFCVGTDGGGSVLGPALAAGLPGIIGAGLGLLGPDGRTSTDGILFRPALGTIGKDWPTTRRAFTALLEAAGIEPVRPAERLRGVRVAVPALATVILPDGADMAELLAPYLLPLWAEGATPVHVSMVGTGEREHALRLLREVWQQADLVVTLEGPVDVYGIGDSIVGSLGEPGASFQARGGKYLLRAANMAGCTAVALPVPRLCSGLILAGPQGREGAALTLGAADLLARSIHMPDLFLSYFFQLD